MSLAIGIALLVVAGALIFFARPDANGNPARFLRFDAALVLYPPFVLIFLGLGAAAVLGSLLK